MNKQLPDILEFIGFDESTNSLAPRPTQVGPPDPVLPVVELEDLDDFFAKKGKFAKEGNLVKDSKQETV